MITRRHLVGGAVTSVLAAPLFAGHAAVARQASAPFIDVHRHAIPPGYEAAASAYLERYAPALAPFRAAYDPARDAEELARSGSVGMLSATFPGIWFGDLAQTRTLAREYNEFMAGVRDRYPGRFGVMAILPLPDVEGALAELKYAFDVLRVDGITMMTNLNEQWPGDPAFAPVFDELDRRGAVVFFHPTVAPCCINVVPGLRAPSLEFGFNTTRAAGSLLVSGTLARCRNIRFIFSHGGAAIPMMSRRLGDAFASRTDPTRTRDAGIMLLKQLYFDIVTVTSPAAFAGLRAFAPATHILFGTDTPFIPAKATLNEVEALHLPLAEHRALLRGNALRLFPRAGGQLANVHA